MNTTEIRNALKNKYARDVHFRIDRFMNETFSYDDTINTNCIEQVYDDFEKFMFDDMINISIRGK